MNAASRCGVGAGGLTRGLTAPIYIPCLACVGVTCCFPFLICCVLRSFCLGLRALGSAPLRLAGPPCPPTQVAIQIGAEVNSQNAMLDSMSTGFDSAGGVLRTTMTNLKSLAEGGSAGHLIILVVVVVVVLFVAAKFLR